MRRPPKNRTSPRAIRFCRWCVCGRLDGTPALLERSTFIWDVGRLRMEFDPDAGSLNHFLLATGVDLDSARHRVDAVAADVEDAEQLGVPVGSPLLRACQITADSTSRILESADVRYVPGHILDAVADLPALVAPASAVALA